MPLTSAQTTIRTIAVIIDSLSQMLTSRILKQRTTSEFVMRRVARNRIDEVIFGGLLAVIALSAVPLGVFEPRWESLFERIIFVVAACWCISVGQRL